MGTRRDAYLVYTSALTARPLSRLMMVGGAESGRKAIVMSSKPNSTSTRQHLGNTGVSTQCAQSERASPVKIAPATVNTASD